MYQRVSKRAKPAWFKRQVPTKKRHQKTRKSSIHLATHVHSISARQFGMSHATQSGCQDQQMPNTFSLSPVRKVKSSSAETGSLRGKKRQSHRAPCLDTASEPRASAAVVVSRLGASCSALTLADPEEAYEGRNKPENSR
jgi:hypothetical protein